MGAGVSNANFPSQEGREYGSSVVSAEIIGVGRSCCAAGSRGRRLITSRMAV